MLTESTVFNRGERVSTRQTRRRAIALASFAVAAGLAIGLLVGLNWPGATASASSESQPALTETGEVTSPDDYLIRYLARVHQPMAIPLGGATPADDYLIHYLARVHQPTAIPLGGATPADDYLTRYLARVHQPTAIPLGGATPADDYLARYLARHQGDCDS